MLYFEIIKDSQEVAKIVESGPVSPHPIPPSWNLLKKYETRKKRTMEHRNANRDQVAGNQESL